MPEIIKTEGPFTGSIIVAEHDKRRIHIIGHFGRDTDPAGPTHGEPKPWEPYEAFMVMGEEWTDGYEIDVETGLENVDDSLSYAEWCEEIEFLIPRILWGDNQRYAGKITDEHRKLVADL